MYQNKASAILLSGKLFRIHNWTVNDSMMVARQDILEDVLAHLFLFSICSLRMWSKGLLGTYCDRVRAHLIEYVNYFIHYMQYGIGLHYAYDYFATVGDKTNWKIMI